MITDYKEKQDKKEEFFVKMKKDCPMLYKGLDYMECPIGWFHLIENLSLMIEHRLSYLSSEEQGNLYVVQAKSKFGGLRFYMAHSNPFIDGAICFAETMSLSICEECGAHAKTAAIGGWLVTLCPDHFQEMLAIKQREAMDDKVNL